MADSKTVARLLGTVSHILRVCSRSNLNFCLKKLEHPEQRRYGCGVVGYRSLLTQSPKSLALKPEDEV